MGKLSDKAALIRSELTPLNLAAQSLLGISGYAACKVIWGHKPCGTALSWLKKSVKPEKTGLQALCDNYNAFIKQNGDKLYFDSESKAARVVPKKLTPEDFADKVNKFSFAEKLGCKTINWVATQNAIDQTMTDYNLLIREGSCDQIDAKSIYGTFGGVSCIYLKSISPNRQKPMLIRATLRVKYPVKFNNKNYYVPCKLYVPIPTLLDTDDKPVEYQGKAYLQGNNLYLNFRDIIRRSNPDSVTMIVDQMNPYTGGLYNGLYSSVSAGQHLYSSAAVLQLRNSVIDISKPSATYNFIESMTKTYPNGVNEISENDVAPIPNKKGVIDKSPREDIKNQIEEKLQTSPFAPFIISSGVE